MKNKLSILILTIPFCFFIGVWWGYKNQFDKHNRKTFEVTILVQDGLLSDPLKKWLAARTGAQVKALTFSSSEDLLKKLNSEHTPIDIVLMNSQLTSALLPEELFFKVSSQKEHVIFRDAPDKLWSEYSYVLGWSLNGYKFSPRFNKQKSKLKKIKIKTNNDPSIFAEALTLIEPSVLNWIKNENKEALLTLFDKLQIQRQLSEDTDIETLSSAQATDSKGFHLLESTQKSNLQLVMGLIHTSTQNFSNSSLVLNELLSREGQNLMFKNSIYSGVNGNNANDQVRFLQNFPMNRYTIKNEASVFSSFWLDLLSDHSPIQPGKTEKGYY